MKQPQLGWTTPVKLTRVYDGDTLIVTVVKELTIRLTNDEGDLDTPEIRRPASEKEIAQGKEVARRLRERLGDDPDLVAFIETSADGQIKDMFSIGSRPVAHLFHDGDDLGEWVEDTTRQVQERWEW